MPAGKKFLYAAAATLIGAAASFLLPTISWAQQQHAKDDFTLRIDGPATVAAGDSAGVVWVIGNHADVNGTVHELVVIDGTASVDGTVTGNIVLLGARADLGPAARVGGDVLLYRSDLQTERGAQIAGAVHNEAGVSFGARALWFLWSGVTVALIIVGIGLAYVAGPSLEKAAETMTLHKRETGLAALILVFGLPIAAIVSFMTGIGFVLGLLILFGIIPIVAFAGYFTVGLSVGRRLMATGRDRQQATAYGSVTIGILALQLLTVIPVFGGLLLLLSCQIGAGALLYTVWSRGRVVESTPSLVNQPA